jgi:hypothetical protein
MSQDALYPSVLLSNGFQHDMSDGGWNVGGAWRRLVDEMGK